VGGFHLRPVPFDFLAGANRHAAEQNDLGKIRGDVEIRIGWFATFAGVEPFLVVAGRARNRWIGTLEIDKFLLRQKIELSAVIVRREDVAFVSDQKTAAARERRDRFTLFVGFGRKIAEHLVRDIVRRLVSTIVPEERNRRQTFASRKFK